MEAISITIRFGVGIDLGLNSYQNTIEYLMSFPEYIISREQPGGPETAHLQCGVLTDKRPDNIKRRILTYFPDINPHQKRYGLKVKKHNDWMILINYCMKEGVVLQANTPSMTERDHFYFKIYHDNDLYDHYAVILDDHGYALPFPPVQNIDFADIKQPRVTNHRAYMCSQLADTYMEYLEVPPVELSRRRARIESERMVALDNLLEDGYYL